MWGQEPSLKGRGNPGTPPPTVRVTSSHLKARILPTVVSPQHLPQGWALQLTLPRTSQFFGARALSVSHEKAGLHSCL